MFILPSGRSGAAVHPMALALLRWQEEVINMGRLYVTLLGTGVLLLALPAGAQTWGRDQYGQPRYEPYYRNDDSYFRDRRYGQNQEYLVGRVVSDLNLAASSPYLDGHERKHLVEVADSLQDFQVRWSHGKFDTGKLDKAIHNLEHLAQADRVRVRDREILSRDLYDLRQFRATRGGYYQRPGYYPNRQ